MVFTAVLTGELLITLSARLGEQGKAAANRFRLVCLVGGEGFYFTY